jgi:hypothetical protein
MPSSLLVMRWSSHISATALALISIITAMAGQLLQGLSPVFFSPLLKRWTQLLTGLTSVACSPYMSPCLWISTGLEPSAVRNSVTTLCQCICTQHLQFFIATVLNAGYWLAPMILVQLDSVAICWVRQDTLLDATFKRGI